MIEFIEMVVLNRLSANLFFNFYMEVRVRERVLLSNQISISHTNIEQKVVWMLPLAATHEMDGKL